MQGEAQGRSVGAYEGWGFLLGVRMFWNQTEVAGAQHRERAKCY